VTIVRIALGQVWAVLRGSRAPFLFTIVLAVVLSAYVQYLWQYGNSWIPVIKGQPPGVWVGLLLVGAALAMWLVAPRRPTGNPWLVAFLGLLLGVWIIELLLSVMHGDAFNYGVWALPIAVMMLAVKTPTRKEAMRGILFFAWLVSGILVLTRLLEMLGVIAMAPVGDALVAYEKSNYWLPLSGWIGPEGRWPGPFFHNSQTGNVGAYLVVTGLALRRRSSVVFVLVGVVTLLITSSRGSMVAAVIGSAIVLFLGDFRWNARLPRPLLVGATMAVGGMAVFVAYLASPNLTGRDAYWGAFIDLWQISPWTGVGITGRMAMGPDSISGTNGHNLIIDALAHYGIFAALVILAILVIAIVIGVKAALTKTVLPLALISTYIVIGIAQSDYNWMTVSNPWLVLVLAVLLGSDSTKSEARVAQGQTV
jgi:hypothetical protein